MTEEKKQLVLRAAKRMTALLIALIMVVEQVPWNAALPIWAKAAVEHEPPDIKGAFNMKTDDSGIQLEKGTITLSKKTRAEGEIQLVANSAATDSTIYDLALHIDTPTIFRNGDGEVFAAIVGETDRDGNAYGPEQYAADNSLEIIGGVEVAFPGLSDDDWQIWNPDNASQLMDDILFMEEMVPGQTGGSVQGGGSGGGSGQGSSDSVDQNETDNSGKDQDNSGSGENGSGSEEGTENGGSGSESDESGSGGETENGGSENSGSGSENGGGSESGSENSGSGSENEGGSESGSENSGSGSENEGGSESGSENSGSGSENGDSSGSGSETSGNDSESGSGSDSHSDAGSTTASISIRDRARLMTAPVASGSTADGDHTAEETPDANEGETAEPDGENAGEKGDEGASEPEGDAPENGGAAEPAPENPSKDQATESGKQETTDQAQPVKPEAVMDQGSVYQVSSFTSSDSSSYNYVFCPTADQMEEGSNIDNLQYYRGNVRLNMIASKTGYKPEQARIVKVFFKFWITDDASVESRFIPEGLLASCWTWVNYYGYQYDDQPNKVLPEDTKVVGFIPEEPRNVNSVLNLLYTNIDWKLNFKTIRGTEENPVHAWQKNNYASYLLSVENTSGLIEEEDGTLYLPPNEEDWVPDETTFEDFDIAMEVPSDRNSAAYANPYQYQKYYMDPDTGALEENPAYADLNGTDVTRLFGGTWIANDLSNVDHDASAYDKSGGVVIVDVTNVKKEFWEVEDPNQLVEEGGTVVGYNWNAGCNFDFVSRDFILYPPQFSKEYNANADSEKEKDHPTKRVYRIFAPFGNSLKLDSERRARATVNTSGVVYFGGKKDKTEPEPQGDDNNENLGYRWYKREKAGTVLQVSSFEANGEKLVQTEEAYVGKELIYTLDGLGVGEDTTKKGDFNAPMYRPQVTDQLPEAFDLQKLQFVLPEDEVDEYSKEGQDPMHFWLGGKDQLAGYGVRLSDNYREEYPILEYQNTEGKWLPVTIPEENYYTEKDKIMIENGAGETVPGVVYTCDVKDFFEGVEDYNQVIRINYRCTWVPLIACPGNVRLVGVSRVAGPRTNTAQFTFSILNFLEKADPAALQAGLLKDPCGEFDVENEIYKRQTPESKPEKMVNPSIISGDVLAETLIKEEIKTDQDELATPAIMDFGNYLWKIRNDSDGEGYNVSFTFKLDEKVQDEQQDAKEGDMVDAFLTSGIRISKALLKAGDEPHVRDEKGRITKIPAPMLTMTVVDETAPGGKRTIQYTRSELMNHIVTDPEGGGVNPLPEYTDNSVYLDLREPSTEPDEEPHPIQIIEFRLDFDSFNGRYILEKPDEEEGGEAVPMEIAEEEPAPVEDLQADQWIRIYGTSMNICTAPGKAICEVKGWKSRFNGEIMEDEQYRYQNEDEAKLKFVMANPTIDAYVSWTDKALNKKFSAKQQPVPYQNQFSYDLALGNDSTAVMYKGIIDLNLDVYDGSYHVEELRYKGFAADYLEFDMSKMLSSESKDNWAEMKEIQFFDVDHRGEKDLPAVTFAMDDLKAFVNGNKRLVLSMEEVRKKGGFDEDWIPGRIVIILNEMDGEMVPEHMVDTDGDGNLDKLVPEKLLHMQVIGHANVYERDLELGNAFTAETQKNFEGKKFKTTATDDGGKKDEKPLGIKKLYVDPNPVVNLDVYTQPGYHENKWSHDHGSRYGGERNPNIGFDEIRPDGTHQTSEVYFENGTAGKPETIRAWLSNYYDNKNSGESQEASSLITGTLELEIPCRLNDGTSDATGDPGDASVNHVLLNRPEGFVSSELRILDKEELSGKIVLVTIHGWKADGSESQIQIKGEDLVSVSGAYVIPRDSWEKEGLILVNKFVVEFEHFAGTVKDKAFYVDLDGKATYGIAYRFKASFHTTDKRLEAVHNREDKPADLRPAEEYYAEDRDQHILKVNDSTAPWLSVAASYQAYQEDAYNETRSDRALMGYDQLAGTVYVPYNGHEKEFIYYVGAAKEPDRVKLEDGSYIPGCSYCSYGGRYDLYQADRLSSPENGYRVLTEGTLLIELPVVALPEDADAPIKGFVFDRLTIEKAMLDKVGEIYSVEFGGLSNQQSMNVHQGIAAVDSVVLGGSENQNPIPDWMDEDGNFVVSLANLQNINGNMEGVRYIRIRFADMAANTGAAASALQVRVSGTTNVYAEDPTLQSRADFFRPERYNFEQHGDGVAGRKTDQPVRIEPKYGYISVQKPHPYAFLQSIFDDDALKDKNLPEANRYTAKSIDANRWYSSLPDNPWKAQAPLGDLFKLPEYDRYQHSYLFTFGNQLIRSQTGKDNSLSDGSFSDIPQAEFRADVPIYSNYEKGKGFLVTKIVIDRDLLKYGKNPSIIIYDKDYKTVIRTYEADEVRTLFDGREDLDSLSQTTGAGVAIDDQDFVITVGGKEAYDLDKDAVVGSVKVVFENYEGNDHIKKSDDDQTAMYPYDGQVLSNAQTSPTGVIHEVSKQNWLRIYGKPTSYHDTQTSAEDAQNKQGVSIGSTVGDLVSGQSKGNSVFKTGEIYQWNIQNGLKEAVAAQDATYQGSTSFEALKAVPTLEVRPYGMDANGKLKYGGNQGSLNASIGGKDAWYGVKLGNTGASRIYQGIVRFELPITSGPVNAQGKQYINGFETTSIVSDEKFIPNITRDNRVYLESITLVEHPPLKVDGENKYDEECDPGSPAKVLIELQKNEKGYIYPELDKLDETYYDVVYVDRDNQEIKRDPVKASEIIKKQGSAYLLSVTKSLWNTKDCPFEHPKNIAVAIGSYTSYKEDTASYNTNDLVKNNESMLLVKGTPTGYIYELDGSGDLAELKPVQDLKMKAVWINTYESNSEYGNILTRTANSFGILHIDPSEPTLETYAVKENTPAAAYDGEAEILPVSYEYKDGTSYRFYLGNSCESGMSQPILAVELPLYDDSPATGEQEESRRGFQMTDIYLDKKLIGNGELLGYSDLTGEYYEKDDPEVPADPEDAGWQPVYDDGVTKVFEIRVYDRLAVEEETGEPVCYVIQDKELKDLLEARTSGNGAVIPHTVWYQEGDSSRCVKYPGKVEIVFDTFEGSVVKDEKTHEDHRGIVELRGEINRYGDVSTYRRNYQQDNVVNSFNQFTDANGKTVAYCGNQIMAKASFIDYVSGTDTKVESKDKKDALDWAAFDVKEPLPKLSAQNQYYNRQQLNENHKNDSIYRNFAPSNSTGGKRNDQTAITTSVDGNTEWNVVPYAREYLSVFGLTNDSISRMENFRFEMTPGLNTGNVWDTTVDDSEKNRGFHTMDLIVRSELFNQAVIDRITIVDENSGKKLVLERVGYTGPQPQKSGDRDPYGKLLPSTEGKEQPETVNANVKYSARLYNLSGSLISDYGEIGREDRDTEYDQVASLAKGLYKTYKGDLVIPRTTIIANAGMSTVSQVLVEGSDFLPMRNPEYKADAEKWNTTRVVNTDQTTDKAETIVFVGISDTKIENVQEIESARETRNQGSFDTYLYGHTYEQWKSAYELLAAKPDGVQDEAGNNFEEVATMDHRRNDTDAAYIKTPQMYFDTTISAVFRDHLTGSEAAAGDWRFTDETTGNYQNRDDQLWAYYPHYMDNNWLTVGYKSLASYTVDFRQLGISSAGVAKNKSGYSLYGNGTVPQDYNAAANVEMVVTLPSDNFDAYFIKLRPKLRPFVNSVTVYPVKGDPYTVTTWRDNASNVNMSSADLLNGEDMDQWWRINLLADPDRSNPDGDGSLWQDSTMPDQYDARDLVGSASNAHRYYKTPSAVMEKGGIAKVVVNMSVNAQAANGTMGNLWEAINADEGTWYEEAYNPETQHEPYNRANQIPNQRTRHSLEIAGRVIRTGSQTAQVGVRLELGSQFNIDDGGSKNLSRDPRYAGKVRPEDKVSRIRVQKSAVSDANTGSESGDNVTVVNSGGAQTKSTWSYRNWHYVYMDYSYYGNTNYSEWHAGHLEDGAEIRVLPSQVQQQKGLGMTAGGKAFAAAGGNIQYDQPTDGLQFLIPGIAGFQTLGLPYYGQLRAYGIGINQLVDTSTEKSTPRTWVSTGTYSGYYIYDYLYSEWYNRFTHVDYADLTDIMPEITRKDGFYKGFFSRYVEISDSIRPNLMSVKVTINEYAQDKDGNTELVDGQPAIAGTRVVEVPYEELFSEYKNGLPAELDGRILFRYAPNTADSLLGNDHLPDHSDGELSSLDVASDHQPGDPLNDQMQQWTGFDNVVQLEKNEYPAEIAVTLVNLSGNGDMTDEYTGVTPDPKQTNNTDPDFYLMGNVCDLLEYNANDPFGIGVWSSNLAYRKPKDNHANYSKDQYGNKQSNYSTGKIGYMQTRELLDGFEADRKISEDQVADKEATYGIPESAQYEVKQANLAVWYAVNIAPNGSTNAETVNGEDDKTAAKPAGVEINTAVANTTRDDSLDANTAQPLQDVYDYDSDNKEPNKVKYRIWAVNGTKQKKDESGREVENLDLTGVYFRELNYQDVLPEGLRTQKLWIPVQFISKTARAAQTDLDSDELKVLKENRFEVSAFKLYTARDVDQKSSELTRSDPNVFGADYNNTNVFDLKKEMLDDLTEADGLLSGTSNPLVSKYMTYETADGTVTEEIGEARYYCVNLEAMFLDGVLDPVQLDTEDGSYFLQHNLLAFDYSLKVRTPWRIDYHQNLMRFFGPNKEGNATLTGVRERVPEGQPASDRFTEDPAELLFEGIFADRKYAAGEAHDSSRKKEWDLNSRPTVDTDPLVLSKIITNRIGLRLHMAGVNSVVNNNRYWDIDNYKKLRFVNRAAKINLSVNRLPYKNNLATASNAGQIIQVPDLTPLPENGDTFNNRPLGMNYNGNDYGKADPDGVKNPPRDLADMEHLVPGDRISYYVTAVNDKDEYPTESGEMRESITWNNPVLRFEAPEGTRIARWTYMPANYPLGEGKRVDANGHYLDADGNEILDDDGKPITDGNNSLIATQPLAITDPDGGVDGYKSIALEDIEAYDPRQPMDGGGYYSVPADQELKDLYSGMEMEKPNIFARFFRSAGSGTPEAEDVVRSIVWKINGDIPVNKGIRLLVVLEVEDPDNNGGSNMKGNFIAESLVAVGGLEAHGYEPFYFTSANPQSQAGSFTEQVYNHITLTDPDGNSYQAGALHTAASPATHLGADEARQEQIGSKDTVTYKRVQAGAEGAFEGDTETMVNGVHAQVLSGGMHIYTEQLPPDVAVSMEDHVDSKEAVLTIGEPQAAKQGSEGMIRNEVHKDLAYMDLTVDFITGNTYSAGETGDVRKLQGFFLNRMPDEDELSYNQTSYGGDRNVMATMYVQLRSDLDEAGQIRADLDGLNVPYDSSRPNADRWARNGYRKVYPKRAGYNPDGWSYYRESDGTYQLLDPRDVARFRLEYAALSASDSAKADEVDDYLTLPAVKLYGISRWADIKPSEAQKDYSYNYTVQVTQEWYRDSSMADNYTTPQPGETTEGSEGKTADEMEQEYKDANGIASTSTADDQSTEIEKNTYRYGIGTSVTYPVLRRMANMSLNAETFDSVEKATASDATPMDGYRPGQELWSRITAENIGRAQKQPVSRDSSGVLRIQYDGTEQGDNPYHWAEDTTKPAGAAPAPAAKEDVLGTGEIYQPVIIDKVPAQFVDIDPRMLPAGGESAVDGNVREVVISDWNNGPIQIRWWNADGTLKTMGTDYEPPQITVYAMTAGDIGGMQSYDRTLLNKVDAEIAPNDADPARTRAADTRYFVYTYTFKDQKLRTALAPGEKIEIVYRTTAKREGLPVTTYQSEDARTGGRVAYLPRFGEYSHSMYYNYYYYGLNTFDPAVDKTGDKLMDMSNLIHDVGFTGSRTGRKAALTPVVKNGTTVYEAVKNADGSDRLYPDSTGQQRYEFLDQSKTVIPGSKVTSYTSMDAGDNSKFFDGDLDSRSRQQVLVGAPLVGNQPDRVTELTYGRDWYSMLARNRTYGQVAPAGVKPEAGEYVNKGVETSMHWDETGDIGDWLPVADEDAGVGLKENILWAEDSLHLRMPWLYTATRFVTERYYAGDINGDYDQYDTRLTENALERMKGRSVYYADEKLRVYTPGIQYGDEYTARLSAVNYGDWALDGVTFTYVLPLGVMPNLNEDGTPDLKAFYGGAPASDDGYLAPEAIADQYVTAEVIQRPWDIVGTDYYPAAKTAADPVLADDYYNNTLETYGRENLPWVVRITVKQPLNGWWGRNITDNLTQKEKGYQITVDLKSVVYAQPDSERFYDMVYTEPWDDGIYVKDGEMQPDSDYCQIYDESHRSGDLTVRQNGAYPNTNNGNASYLVTGWLDRNNYQQIYGMNKVYQAKIGYWGVSTSNFWMFPAFTAYANGRNLFCAMYSAADGEIPAAVTDYKTVEGSGRDTVYSAVSGSQARLLVPVVRHWSEVADEQAGEPGHTVEDEKKLDEFYQNMEEPFKISLFAENQVVMKNITMGRNIQNNGTSSAGTVHYQDPVTDNYLNFIKLFFTKA